MKIVASEISRRFSSHRRIARRLYSVAFSGAYVLVPTWNAAGSSRLFFSNIKGSPAPDCSCHTAKVTFLSACLRVTLAGGFFGAKLVAVPCVTAVIIFRLVLPRVVCFLARQVREAASHLSPAEAAALFEGASDEGRVLNASRGWREHRCVCLPTEHALYFFSRTWTYAKYQIVYVGANH